MGKEESVPRKQNGLEENIPGNEAAESGGKSWWETRVVGSSGGVQISDTVWKYSRKNLGSSDEGTIRWQGPKG